MIVLISPPLTPLQIPNSAAPRVVPTGTVFSVTPVILACVYLAETKSFTKMTALIVALVDGSLMDRVHARKLMMEVVQVVLKLAIEIAVEHNVSLATILAVIVPPSIPITA